MQGANEPGSTEVEFQGSETIDLTGNPLTDQQTESSSSSSASLNNSIELELSVDDSLNPNKIRRSIPLKMKSSDPAQCMDMLDSMYEIYYDQEVSNIPTKAFHITHNIIIKI